MSGSSTRPRRKLSSSSSSFKQRCSSSAASGSSKRKSSKSSASDSPGNSADNVHGKSAVDKRLRSVLSHPLGLPLVYMLNGKDPGSLPFLARKSKFHNENKNTDTNPSTNFDDIFSIAVNKWIVDANNLGKKRLEPKLTKLLSAMIQCVWNETGFYSDAEVDVDAAYGNDPIIGPKPRIDILLTPRSDGKDGTEESTPLAVIEVGRKDSDWWMKLDQNIKYLVRMGDHQKDKRLRLGEPLLCVALTIEDEDETEELMAFKLGVFLCSPKDASGVRADFRLTLLWQFSTHDMEEASKAFGKLLRTTSDFNSWREASATDTPHSFEYFSSNCSRVGDMVSRVRIPMIPYRLNETIVDSLITLPVHLRVPRWQVLRSYDSRFRETNRSSEIYRSKKCHSIVGEGAVVLELSAEDAANEFIHNNDKNPESRTLEIIATPYREGVHEAKLPKAFLPIIDQLQELHEKGFVHGDIRAFNTVFGETADEGWLIDFDFGGKVGATVYPSGYRAVLEDGLRLGESEKAITKRHDWYALTRLMFVIHDFHPPDGVNEPDVQIASKLELYDSNMFWKGNKNDPTKEEIDKLKGLLIRLDGEGWTVRPSELFEKARVENVGEQIKSNQGATGSPPQKNA